MCVSSAPAMLAVLGSGCLCSAGGAGTDHLLGISSTSAAFYLGALQWAVISGLPLVNALCARRRPEEQPPRAGPWAGSLGALGGKGGGAGGSAARYSSAAFVLEEHYIRRYLKCAATSDTVGSPQPCDMVAAEPARRS